MGGDFSVLDLQDWRAQTTALASLGGVADVIPRQRVKARERRGFPFDRGWRVSG